MVYYFLFPRGAGQELLFETESLAEFPGTMDLSGVGGPVVGIPAGRDVVYLGSDGLPLARQPGKRPAVSGLWWADSGPDGVEIRDPGGGLRAKVGIDAFPIARNGSLYLYKDGFSVVAKADPATGKLLWTREFLSPVTVLDGRGDRTLIGLLDGRCLLLDGTGGVLLEYKPGRSRIEAIYGGALSADGTKIAIIAGADPQRFIVLEEQRTGFRPVSHRPVNSDFRRYIPVGFIRNDSTILYETEGYLAAAAAGGLDQGRLELHGAPFAWWENSAADVLAVLSGDAADRWLQVFSRHNLPVFESRILASADRVEVHRDRVYLFGSTRCAVLRMSVR